MDTKISLENKIVSSASDLDKENLQLDSSKRTWISPAVCVVSIRKITMGGATATPEFDGGFIGS